MRVFVSLIAVLLIAEAGVAGTHVPMAVAADGIISVPVLVNGQGPFQFIVDTGSNRSVISADLAQALGLPIVAKTEVFAATGREFRPVAQLIASIGSSSSITLTASIVAGEKLRTVLGSAAGIVGQDFLMTLNYTLDYENGQFINSLPAKRDRLSVELPVEVAEGRVVLALPSQRGHSAARFVPDSGSTTFVVYDRGGKPHFAMESVSGAMRVETMTSTRTVPMFRLREVRLGTMTLRDQLAAVVKRTDEMGLDIDGLLPLRVFARAAFDMEGRRMIVTPRR